MKDILECKKITILGPCGSGKSWLAAKLGELLGLPVHHLDYYYLKPNWVTEDKVVICNKIDEITKGASWVIDGNYRRNVENRFDCSDTVIILNLPAEFCIENVKNRAGKKRIGLPPYLEGAPDDIDYLIKHITEFPERMKNTFSLMKKFNNKTIEFTSREQVNEFIKSIESNK